MYIYIYIHIRCVYLFIYWDRVFQFLGRMLGRMVGRLVGRLVERSILLTPLAPLGSALEPPRDLLNFNFRIWGPQGGPGASSGPLRGSSHLKNTIKTNAFLMILRNHVSVSGRPYGAIWGGQWPPKGAQRAPKGPPGSPPGPPRDPSGSTRDPPGHPRDHPGPPQGPPGPPREAQGVPNGPRSLPK